MTKSTITREQLEEWVAQFDEDGGCDATDRQLEALIRQSLAAMDSEPVEMPLDYLQGHKDGLEWAARLAEANHPETGDWLYDDPIELAKAIRKGPDMPPAQPVADSEPVAWTWQHLKQWHVTNDEERARDLAWDGVKVEPLYRHAQPEPVVPDEKDKTVDADDHPLLWSFNEGWNACRAAMLQAGNSPAQSDCCPAQNVVVPAQRPIDHGYRPERQCSVCKATSRICAELAGNPPVIPDGSTAGMFNSARALLDALYELGPDEIAISEHVTNLEDALRNAAATQSPGSEPATVPGKWIPVSEKMPPSRHEVLVGCWWGEKPRWCCKWATYIPGHPDAQSSGWLIPGASWTPTHWMPLPAGPQEDINALIPLVSRNEQEVK